jgi:hypothetical protein
MIDIVFVIPEITKGMKSFGPKSLIHIKNISVIEHQLMQIRSHFRNNHIYLLTGFESDKIKKVVSSSRYVTKKKHIHILENKSYESHNQTSSIHQYAQQYQSNHGAMFINNGILTKYNFSKIINKNKNHLFFVGGQKANFNIGSSQLDSIEYLFYDLPNLWSECVYLTNQSIHYIKELNIDNIKSIFFFELINQLIDKQFEFDSATIPKTQILKIINIKDTSKVKNFINA